MKTETEVKFLSLNHDDLREKLKALGATCLQPMRLMRRAIIDFPDRRLMRGEINSYIRVRDEGDKVTLTFKQFASLSVDGAREIETTVGSFEDTIGIFVSAGLEAFSLQESKRETWEYKGYEIVLDEWPWLNPYIEIEGESEDGLKSIVKELELDWSKAAFGDVMVAYRAQYPHLKPDETVANLKEVRFNTPLPQFLVPSKQGE
jgi:adenylate cyclase class 2